MSARGGQEGRDLERARVVWLERAGLEDARMDPELSEIVAVAAEVCGCPAAGIAFVGRTKVTFVAEQGLGVRELPRGGGVCEAALGHPEPLLIADLARDDGADPLLASHPHLRFHAAAVLRTEDGVPLGTLSVLDVSPRTLTATQRRTLEVLARQVVVRLELRHARRVAEADALGEPYRAMFESNPLPMWVYELETLRFLAVNDAAVQHYGYTRARFLAMTIAEIGLDDDVPALRAHVPTRDQGLVKTGVWRHRLADGRVIRAEISTHAVTFAGRAARLVLALDVTNQLAASEELHANQTLVQIASRIGRLGAWSLELPGLEYRMSDETRAIHEVDASFRPTAMELSSFYVGEHQPRIVQLFEACIVEGAPFDEEMRFRTAKGRELWVRVIGEAVRDDAGQIIRVQGAIQDIDERRRAESSLAASERRFRELAEAMPLIVWTATPAGEIDFVNARFYDATGADPALPLEATWDACLHPDDRSARRVAWARAVASGEDYELEVRLRHRDGAYRWYRAQARLTRDGEGRPLKWYGTRVDIDETKQLEARATRLATRLTTTFESITDALFTLDREWRFVYLNAEAERLLERRREELHGRVVWDEFPAALSTQFDEAYHRAMREQVTVSIEEHYPPLDKWFEVHAYPSAEGLAVYFRDVTEKRRTRNILRASEERFRLLANATNDLIWDCDLTSRTLWWSEGFLALTGASPTPADAAFTAWTERIHPEDRERVVAHTRTAIESGASAFVDEYRFQRADYTYADVQVRGSIIRTPDGVPLRLVGGITDLSERKRAEQKLRDQAMLLDRARDAILVRDLDHQIRYWNHGAERLYGARADEVIGETCEDLLYLDKAGLLAATQSTLATGEWTGELEQRTRDGRSITVLSRWSLLYDEARWPKAILSINTDVTELKRVEQQLLRAQRMESIGTLAGGIAHDLNNVLQPIMMSVELLGEAEADELRRECVDTITMCAQRGADMVRQLLSFGRGTDGERRQVSVPKIVSEIQNIIRDTFPKNVVLQVSIAPEVQVVSANATQLHQLLLNLCVNARDAMPDGGLLRIHVENVVVDDATARANVDARPGRFVRIELQDRGVGMPPEVLARIFDPFFTTKEVGKGTGLGLSTAHAIARSHGGFIQVRSEVGRGTRFSVYLPALETHAPGAVAARRETTTLGHGRVVLVVDDEERIRALTRHTLEHAGFHVVLAANGAEAVSLFSRHRAAIAAVVMDLSMPVMDGLAACAAFHQLEPAVPIIGASGHPTGPFSERVQRFVQKPYTGAELLQALAEVVGHEAVVPR